MTGDPQGIKILKRKTKVKQWLSTFVIMEAAGTLPGYVASTDYGTLFFDLNEQVIANFERQKWERVRMPPERRNRGRSR